jgi:hypothetical protein
MGEELEMESFVLEMRGNEWRMDICAFFKLPHAFFPYSHKNNLWKLFAQQNGVKWEKGKLVALADKMKMEQREERRERKGEGDPSSIGDWGKLPNADLCRP